MDPLTLIVFVGAVGILVARAIEVAWKRPESFGEMIADLRAFAEPSTAVAVARGERNKRFSTGQVIEMPTCGAPQPAATDMREAA